MKVSLLCVIISPIFLVGCQSMDVTRKKVYREYLQNTVYLSADMQLWKYREVGEQSSSEVKYFLSNKSGGGLSGDTTGDNVRYVAAVPKGYPVQIISINKQNFLIGRWFSASLRIKVPDEESVVQTRIDLGPNFPDSNRSTSVLQLAQD